MELSAVRGVDRQCTVIWGVISTCPLAQQPPVEDKADPSPAVCRIYQVKQIRYRVMPGYLEWVPPWFLDSEDVVVPDHAVRQEGCHDLIFRFIDVVLQYGKCVNSRHSSSSSMILASCWVEVWDADASTWTCLLLLGRFLGLLLPSISPSGML